MVAQKSTVTLFHWLCGSIRLSWIDWSLNGFPPSLSIKPFSYSISDCSVFSHRDHIYILTYWASSGASQRCCSKGVIQIPTGNLTTKIHFSACSNPLLSSPNCHEASGVFPLSSCVYLCLPWFLTCYPLMTMHLSPAQSSILCQFVSYLWW